MTESTKSTQALLDIMARLRDPESGCPWDVKQTFETIAPYTIEEAYEVDDAIRNADMAALKDELGDLLLQVVFHSQIAKEAGLFTFADVATSIAEKMITRHPHVFSDAQFSSENEQSAAWETLKAKERETKKTSEKPLSALDGIASNLPALLRAIKLQKRAARVGFDWPDIHMVLDKISEETSELVDEYSSGTSKERIEEEFGDLLFVLVNLGRHMKLDSEEALRKANAKFERRFKGVEQKLRDRSSSPEASTLEEMDRFWEEVKAEEKALSAAS